MDLTIRNNPNMDIAKIIGTNLAALMASNDALDTCKEVAAKSKVGFGTVQRAKNGDANITVEKLTAIAQAFKRHPAELMIEQPSAMSPPAIANYSNVIEGRSTRLEANESAALAEIIDLPPPLLPDLTLYPAELSAAERPATIAREFRNNGLKRPGT